MSHICVTFYFSFVFFTDGIYQRNQKIVVAIFCIPSCLLNVTVTPLYTYFLLSIRSNFWHLVFTNFRVSNITGEETPTCWACSDMPRSPSTPPGSSYYTTSTAVRTRRRTHCRSACVTPAKIHGRRKVSRIHIHTHTPVNRHGRPAYCNTYQAKMHANNDPEKGPIEVDVKIYRDTQA